MSSHLSLHLYLMMLPSLAELKFEKIVITVQDNILLVNTNQEQRNSKPEIVLYSA